LSHHQRDQACACSHIQDMHPLSGAGPCTEQHTIRTHFHGTLVMIDGKLFEPEIGVRHILSLMPLFGTTFVQYMG